MIKTFIYGNPHGFNLYEKDSMYNDYVKGFYISSRKGRRMMVNRRNNGETTYNYLRYGLREAIDRPTNAFFGMTLVVDGNLYCSDFHKILEWFDFIFDKIVKERNIFVKDELGNAVVPLKYAIHKFEEASTDVEWIKSNLPNIFSSAAGTRLLRYDNSFVQGKTGQVSGLNDKESEENILKMFKQYCWITLSPEYKLGVEKPVISELNYADLKATLDEYNKELVPIATAIATGKYEGNDVKLTSMEKESKESLSLLQNYLKIITDEKEGELFKGLTSDYRLFADSITALLSNRSYPQPLLKPEEPLKPENTQYCFHCKQKKSPSQFRSPEATKCLDCEKEEKIDIPEIKIRCAKCGKFKTSEHFRKGLDVCNECQQHPPQLMTCKRCGKKKPIKDFPHNGDTCNSCLKEIYWKELLHKSFIPMLGVLAVFIVLGGIYWFFFKSVEPKKEQVVVVEEKGGDIINENNVSVETFNQYLENKDYLGAYQYISDKTDKANYMQNIRDAIDRDLWDVIETSTSNANEIKSKIAIKIRPISETIENLGLGDEYIEEINQGIEKFVQMMTIQKKTTITKTEYETACNLLAELNGKLKQDWKAPLDKKWENSKVLPSTETMAQSTETMAQSTETKAQSQEKKADAAKKVTFTLTYYNKDGVLQTMSNITSAREVRAKVGTIATVTCTSGEFQFNNRKKSLRLNVEPNKPAEFICGNFKIVVQPLGPSAISTDLEIKKQ